MKEGEPISAADLLANLEDDETMKKRQTGMTGLDWVFDGGLPYFGAILLCAKAGTGKSTFLWEMLRWLAKKKVSTLYISSEQSLKDLGRQFWGMAAALMSCRTNASTPRGQSGISRSRPGTPCSRARRAVC